MPTEGNEFAIAKLPWVSNAAFSFEQAFSFRITERRF